MRAEVRSIRATMRRGLASGAPLCPMCERPKAARAELCGRCRKQLSPSPLDSVLDAIGVPAKEFAGATGIPLRTIYRAVRGDRMSARVAKKLAEITKLPVTEFRRAEEDEDEEEDE